MRLVWGCAWGSGGQHPPGFRRHPHNTVTAEKTQRAPACAHCAQGWSQGEPREGDPPGAMSMRAGRGTHGARSEAGALGKAPLGSGHQGDSPMPRAEAGGGRARVEARLVAMASGCSGRVWGARSAAVTSASFPATVLSGCAQIRGSSFSMNSFTASISCAQRQSPVTQVLPQPVGAAGQGPMPSAVGLQVGHSQSTAGPRAALCQGRPPAPHTSGQRTVLPMSAPAWACPLPRRVFPLLPGSREARAPEASLERLRAAVGKVSLLQDQA